MSVCIDRADRFAGSIGEGISEGQNKNKVTECQEEHKGPRCQFNEITAGRPVRTKSVLVSLSQDLDIGRGRVRTGARLALRSVSAWQR